MNKEQQNLAWACLPKEVRNNILSDYEYYLKRYEAVKANTSKGAIDALEDIFGHHNLTSNTEPSEMLIVKRNELVDYYSTIKSKVEKQSDTEDYGAGHFDGQLAALDYFFGDKCLPDEDISKMETTTQPSVQGEPKFEAGDKVKVNDVRYNQVFGAFGIVKGVEKMGEDFFYTLENDTTFRECYLEPYTEPETKDNMEKNRCEKCGANTQQCADAPCQNYPLEEKELNLVELLKGCEGETFFSLIDGEAKLKEIHDYTVICQYHSYHLRGHLFGSSLDGVCLLYPSRALYEKYPLDAPQAWREWQESHKPKRWRAKEGEIYWLIPLGGSPILSHKEYFTEYQNKLYEFGNYFRTKEEAYQAAEVVKKALMEFHEKNTEK